MKFYFLLSFYTFAATDEYTRWVYSSVHVTQPYTGSTGHNQLAPRQISILPMDGTPGKIGLFDKTSHLISN